MKIGSRPRSVESSAIENHEMFQEDEEIEASPILEMSFDLVYEDGFLGEDFDAVA